jgi:predicted short-subunit dehydrogenase-like oxidoreductase (DUF2520 family)
MHRSDDTGCQLRLAIVGSGRLGSALARALRGNAPEVEGNVSAVEVVGPLGRGDDPQGSDAVLLCVPDAEIAYAAAAIGPGPLVGHCSGATGLEPLAPHEAFSLHPLMTVTAAEATFNGAAAAIDGSTERATALAGYLAGKLGLEPIHVRPADRAAYHAAASMASNFLVTLEAAAEQLAATAGIERRMLLPLVHATVENWAAVGGERALTGPVARGDIATVARQRDAVSERAPELLTLFDALTEATRELAVRRELETA